MRIATTSPQCGLGLTKSWYVVLQIITEETGTDYLKLKEYYPETGPGETMTIAPGSGPSTDVASPIVQPHANTPDLPA